MQVLVDSMQGGGRLRSKSGGCIKLDGHLAGNETRRI